MRVLVAALGMSPAVVTETLWWLHRHAEPLPERIVVVTTVFGEQSARNRLCDGEGRKGGLSRFCEDFGVRPIVIDFRIPVDGRGVPYADINDTASAAAMADLFAEVVRDLTRDPQNVLHASIAGGRKTMSYQLGYAMTLFGREVDRLTHVLIRPPAFEGIDDFLYPPPVPVDLKHKHTGETHNTGAVDIDLADIPFLPVRGFLDEETLSGRRPLDHMAIRRRLERWQRSTGRNEPGLVFHADGRSVSVAGIAIDLPAKAYALFRLYAEAAKERWPGASPAGVGPEHRGWIATARFDDPADPVVARFVDLWDAHPDKDDADVVRARRAVQAYRTNRGSSEFKLTDPLSQCLDLNTVRSRVKERIVDPIVGECHGVPPLMASFLLASERQHGRRSGIPAAPDDILFE